MGIGNYRGRSGEGVPHDPANRPESQWLCGFPAFTRRNAGCAPRTLDRRTACAMRTLLAEKPIPRSPEGIHAVLRTFYGTRRSVWATRRLAIQRPPAYNLSPPDFHGVSTSCLSSNTHAVPAAMNLKRWCAALLLRPNVRRATAASCRKNFPHSRSRRLRRLPWQRRMRDRRRVAAAGIRMVPAPASSSDHDLKVAGTTAS